MYFDYAVKIPIERGKLQEPRSQSKSKQRNGEPLYVIGRDDER